MVFVFSGAGCLDGCSVKWKRISSTDPGRLTIPDRITSRRELVSYWPRSLCSFWLLLIMGSCIPLFFAGI